MVFMIKLPAGQTMPPAADSQAKSAKLSLLKSQHRPHCRNVHGVPHYGHGSLHQQYSHSTWSSSSSLSDSEINNFCSFKKPIICFCVFFITIMILFVFFLLSMRKSPSENSFPKYDSLIESVEIPSNRGEVAVKTTCGHVIGRSEDGAYGFKGIAYAKPPVGNLRWRKPVPLWIDSTWCEEHRTQEAFQFGSKCFQLNPYSKQYEGSEDCLYLNVWTPSLDLSNGGLEVMVWIHGGFLQFGSGNEPGISPSAKLAKKLNVIFVSINYRLYTLGFMALDILSNDILADSKGNYGLWDQLCALQWVKDNIRNFGGNPRKVTIFGPDAGAASIIALMSSPKAQGLFRSAWLTGPTMLFNKTFEEVNTHNKGLFLRRSKCKDQACLRNSDAQDIIATHLGKDDPSFRIRDQNDLPIQGIFPEQLIVIDDDLLKDVPTFHDLDESEVKSIPILLGSAAQAVDFWPGPDDLSTWTWNQYKKYVTTSLDSFGMQVSQLALRIYNGTAAQIQNPENTAEYLYTSMVSDIRQSCPVNSLARRLASHSRFPVYKYTLTGRPSKPVKLFNYTARYSFHLWDVISFFGDIQMFHADPDTEDYAFSETIQSVVLNFVKSGGESTGNSDWLRYPKKSANLARNITFGSINKTECKFWSENKLEVYAWVS